MADYRYYYLPFEETDEKEGQLRVRGFGSVAMIRDLMNLMPEPAPRVGQELHELWRTNFNFLNEISVEGKHMKRATQAERGLTLAINDTRETVVMVLRSLE